MLVNPILCALYEHRIGFTIRMPGLREQVPPNWDYLHVTCDVVPALRERGVTSEQANLMLRGDLRRGREGDATPAVEKFRIKRR